MFWMPAQALNFALVPQTMRVVYIGSCSFLWVNILCILKREEKTEDENDKQEWKGAKKANHLGFLSQHCLPGAD